VEVSDQPQTKRLLCWSLSPGAGSGRPIIGP
jgi:hypothetical protein